MRPIHVEYHLPGSLTTNSFQSLGARLEAVWVLKFRFKALSQTGESHDPLLNNLLIRVMYILKGDGSSGVIIIDYKGESPSLSPARLRAPIRSWHDSQAFKSH